MTVQSNQPVSQDQEQKQVKQTSAPFDVMRDGALKVSLFQNNHQKGTSYALKPTKLYKDKHGNTQETSSFSEHDALKLMRLFEKGYDRINDFKQAQKNKSLDKGDGRDR